MKKIALLMESWKRCFTYAWSSGMLQRIRETGAEVNLYVFNSSANWREDEAYNHGEYNIFRLPDLKEFDGIVLDYNNITRDDVKEQLIELVRQSRVPAVVIGNRAEGLYSVEINNREAMQVMLKHLHQHHHCKKYWFIMGPEDNYENKQRVNGILEYLEEKKIEKEGCAFYYGNFECSCGEDGFSSLYGKYGELPDAVVCANDNIAVGVLDAAQKQGWNAPEDFLVTGFDDLDKSRYFKPRISTMSYVREELGSACIDLFLKIWNGENPDRICYTKSTPIFWESCGCPSEIVIDEREHLKNQILYNVEMSYFEENILSLKYQLLRCNTVEEMLRCIPECVPAMKCDAMYLVMDSYFEELQRECMDVELALKEENFMVEGYPEKMTVAFSYDVTGEQNQGGKHWVKGLFPMFECEEKCVDFLFLPLHFQEKCMGYFAIRNANYLMEKQFLFEITNALTYALEDMYQRGKLSRLNQALSTMYNRDSMTMLYNRMGLKEYAVSFMKKEHSQGRQVLVMYVDLDRLKYINDNLGHEMGDEIIKGLAGIIQKKVSEDGLAFRLGGDEFLVVDRYESEGKVKEWCEGAQQELREVGASKEVPIELSVSMGYVVTNPDSTMVFEEYMSRADEKMYQDKVARKRERIR